VFPVQITKEQVKNCPGIDIDKLVSRQDEMSYLAYYGSPYSGGGAVGRKERALYGGVREGLWCGPSAAT
jgi:hypothetical protein